MINSQLVRLGLPTLLLAVLSLPAAAQSFRVQCPYSTITHPAPSPVTPIPSGGNVNSFEPAYTAPTTYAPNTQGFLAPTGKVNGAIKCQQISGGDGYATMADGTQTFMFSFGPLSGIADIANGQPGTEYPDVFNIPFGGAQAGAVGGATPLPGDPATTDGAVAGATSTSLYVQGNWQAPAFTYNGAIGQIPDATCAAEPASCVLNTPTTPTSGTFAYIDGHVDPRQIMDVGVMNGNIPAPLMAMDEDDEFFLTLTNVGMIMRPDLFEQHTVHFHGYPNASPFYDGVPDASVAINIDGSFTYYYLAPDAGTYFWHCHISPPEHLQMGMVGQIYVRPRQNRVTGDLSAALIANNTKAARPFVNSDSWDGKGCNDILCTGQTPVPATSASGAPGAMYAYNDGDGSTRYDIDVPVQIHGFDPNFHFIGMTFN